jgi:hypothetical protein
MPLGWDQKKKLARLTGLVVDISRSPAAGSPDPADREALSDYLSMIEQAIAASFAEGGALAEEFSQLFVKAEGVPPQAKAAAIGGWLRELLIADAHEAELVPSAPLQELSRMVSIGFKLRSPIVREGTDVSGESAAG